MRRTRRQQRRCIRRFFARAVPRPWLEKPSGAQCSRQGAQHRLHASRNDLCVASLERCRLVGEPEPGRFDNKRRGANRGYMRRFLRGQTSQPRSALFAGFPQAPTSRPPPLTAHHEQPRPYRASDSRAATLLGPQYVAYDGMNPNMHLVTRCWRMPCHTCRTGPSLQRRSRAAEHAGTEPRRLHGRGAYGFLARERAAARQYGPCWPHP